MTLSRWRRVATGIAAGVIVLSAALLGASFRDDSSGVSVASDLRPATIIEVPEDDTDAATPAEGDDDAVTVIEAEDLPADPDTSDPETPDTSPSDSDTSDSDASDSDASDSATSDSATADSDTADSATADSDTADSAESTTDGSATDDSVGGNTTEEGATEDDSGADSGVTDTATAGDDETSEAPLTAADDALGTGGGVDDAECALDRLVIYAGARVGGVAGSIRSALTQAGFGADCPTPVAVLASNCPLQFAGVLGAGSGYDPLQSFVASSASVDRDAMTAVIGTVGYSGSEINILDFSFINADKPGEQWMAIFIPPSFAGWETLSDRAGLTATDRSLCAPSGELAG